LHAAIDAYYALEPFSYSELLEAVITPAHEPATQGLTVRLALASRVDTDRQLALPFASAPAVRSSTAIRQLHVPAAGRASRRSFSSTGLMQVEPESRIETARTLPATFVILE